MALPGNGTTVSTPLTIGGFQIVLLMCFFLHHSSEIRILVGTKAPTQVPWEYSLNSSNPVNYH